MKNKFATKYLRTIAITGNILYIMWIVRNGIDEGFKATPVEMASYIGLIILLIINLVLLIRRK